MEYPLSVTDQTLPLGAIVSDRSAFRKGFQPGPLVSGWLALDATAAPPPVRLSISAPIASPIRKYVNAFSFQ